MVRQFPLANKTFTVKRHGVTSQGANKILETTTVMTGLSIYLQVLQGVIMDGKGGTAFAAVYKGSTFSDAPLFIGDLLYDEAVTTTNPDGTAVCYTIEGLTVYPSFMFLHLVRSLPG